jgi:hypothetical protein
MFDPIAFLDAQFCLGRDVRTARLSGVIGLAGASSELATHLSSIELKARNPGHALVISLYEHVVSGRTPESWVIGYCRCWVWLLTGIVGGDCRQSSSRADKEVCPMQDPLPARCLAQPSWSLRPIGGNSGVAVPIRPPCNGRHQSGRDIITPHARGVMSKVSV